MHKALFFVPLFFCVFLLIVMPDCHTTEEMAGLFAITTFLAYHLGRRFHPVIGLAYFYYSFINIPRMLVPHNMWQGFDATAIIAFSSMVRHSELYITAFALAFLLIKRLKNIEFLLVVLGVINSLVVTGRFLVIGQGYFLFNNSAIDSAFIASVMPLIYKKLKNDFTETSSIILMFILCSPLLLTVTSSGILGLGLLIFFYLAFNKRLKLGLFLVGAIAGIGYGLTYWNDKISLINSNGRLTIWKLTMKYWWEHVNHFFGTGTGTFYVYGPAIQIQDAVLNKVEQGTLIDGFTWMHNDWLETLFTSGYIGLTIAIATYFIALWKLRARPAYFTSLFIFGAIAVIQMPLRWFIFAGLGAFLIATAFTPPKVDNTYDPQQNN